MQPEEENSKASPNSDLNQQDKICKVDGFTGQSELVLATGQLLSPKNTNQI